jgi:hypothetical protein
MLFVYRTGTILSAVIITENSHMINTGREQCLTYVAPSLVFKTSTFYTQNVFTCMI